MNFLTIFVHCNKIHKSILFIAWAIRYIKQNVKTEGKPNHKSWQLTTTKTFIFSCQMIPSWHSNEFTLLFFLIYFEKTFSIEKKVWEVLHFDLNINTIFMISIFDAGFRCLSVNDRNCIHGHFKNNAIQCLIFIKWKAQSTT